MGKIQDFTFLKEIKQCESVLKDNNYSLLDNHFERIYDLNNKPLKLAIMGECSAGKSTFINKLVNNNKEILPTGFIPVTSTVTKLCYSETEKIEVVKNNNGQIETKEHIGYEQLESYQRASESTDIIYAEELRKIQEINVFVKNELLKSFYIIDTPGFNQNADISEVTKSIFDSVDFIIWLTKGALISDSESKIIKELSEYNKDMYCVNNFADQLIDKKSMESFKNDLAKNYSDIFINYNCTHFISCDPEKNDDREWANTFSNLVNDLKNRILTKDIDLSKDLIKKEYFVLKNKISIYESRNKALKEQTISLLDEQRHYFNLEEYNNKLNQTIEEILEYIQSKLINIKKQIFDSKAYKGNVPNSVLEFYSQALTYEVMAELEKELKRNYEKFMGDISSELIISLNNIKKLYLNTDSLKIENEKSIVLEIDNLILLAKTSFVSSNKLLIIGGLLGVLSNNYLYKLIRNSKSYDTDSIKNEINEKINEVKSKLFSFGRKSQEKTKEQNTIDTRIEETNIVSFVTIKELLERDFNINYFIEMIEHIRNGVEKIINNQIEILEKSKMELKENKESN